LFFFSFILHNVDCANFSPREFPSFAKIVLPFP
jgi:hypothetical protein